MLLLINQWESILRANYNQWNTLSWYVTVIRHEKENIQRAFSSNNNLIQKFPATPCSQGRKGAPPLGEGGSAGSLARHAGCPFKRATGRQVMLLFPVPELQGNSGTCGPEGGGGKWI